MAGIFGPTENPAMASHIQNMANVLQIPHIETRWDYNFERSDFSLNVYPHPSVIGKAYADFVKYALLSTHLPQLPNLWLMSNSGS